MVYIFVTHLGGLCLPRVAKIFLCFFLLEIKICHFATTIHALWQKVKKNPKEAADESERGE